MSCQLSAQDEYGFLRGADFDFPGQEEFLSSYLGILARRAQRWDALLGQGGSYEKLKRGNQLKRFVRKGIPGSHRKGVWMEVSGASQLRKQQPGEQKIASTSEILYGSLQLCVCNCGFDFVLERLYLKRCTQWLRGRI